MTIGRLGCFKRPGLDHSRTSYFRSRIYPEEAYRRSPMTKIWMKSLTHPLFKSIRQTKVTHFVFASMSWHFKMLPISHSLSLHTNTDMLTPTQLHAHTLTITHSLTHTHTYTNTLRSTCAPWQADILSLSHTHVPTFSLLPSTHPHAHTHTFSCFKPVRWMGNGTSSDFWPGSSCHSRFGAKLLTLSLSRGQSTTL